MLGAAGDEDALAAGGVQEVLHIDDDVAPSEGAAEQLRVAHFEA